MIRATFIRDLSRTHDKHQALYRLSEPIKYWDDYLVSYWRAEGDYDSCPELNEKGEIEGAYYVMVSAVDNNTIHETSIFAARHTGEVLNWCPFSGVRGVFNHAVAIAEAGWVLDS